MRLFQLIYKSSRVGGASVGENTFPKPPFLINVLHKSIYLPFFGGKKLPAQIERNKSGKMLIIYKIKQTRGSLSFIYIYI